MVGDIYNTKAAKVIMNVFINKVLWRHRDESDYVCPGQSGTRHREGEAFELGF